jgi:phospholipid transport system substrate-binding protein
MQGALILALALSAASGPGGGAAAEGAGPAGPGTGAAPPAASGGATEALRERAEEIRRSLPPAGTALTPPVRQRIENLVTRIVDLRGMLQAALGARWGELTEKQRKRLVAAFESRFKTTSGSELDPYRTTQIEYRPEVEDGQGVVKVPTRVVIKGEPTDITYAMRKEKEGWRIVDIVIDDVSTVANYRSSFNRVIAKDGVEALINRLERGAATKS